MSYGQNAPQGFQSYGTTTAATFTGQMVSYAIQSGLNQDIFTGDPVVLDAGYLKPVTDGTTVKLLSAMPLGIFQGCEWNSPDANVQGLAKSPYWSANTVVQPFGGIDSAYAWVITDASSIKADPVGLPLVILGFTRMPGNTPGMPFCNVIVGWNPKIVKPGA